MTTSTGFGRSKGVAYTYDLFEDSWFGRYICRVDESLLDRTSKEFYTDQFHVGGYAWQLFLEPTSDGNLSAFLYTQSSCSLFVYFSISLVNRNETKSKVWGSSKGFASVPSWGVKKLASLAEIKDPDAGFINRGFFIIKLEMRLKLPGNEFTSVSTDGTAKIFTWKLRDLDKKSPVCMLTEPLHVGNSTWRIVLYPYGKVQGKNYMAVYLYSNNESVVKAKFHLSISNRVSPARSIEKELVQTFTKCRQAHGWGQVLQSAVLENDVLGFVKDGWITLTARISKCRKSVQFSEITEEIGTAEEVVLQPGSHRGESHGTLPTVDEVQTLEPQQEEQSRRRGQKYLDYIQSTDSASWNLKNQKKQPESVAHRQAIIRTITEHETCTDDSSTWLDLNNMNSLSRVVLKEDLIRSRSLGDIPRFMAQAGLESLEAKGQCDLSERLSRLVSGVSFANKYLIETKRVAGKPHVRFAIDKASKQSVVLKFYSARKLFEKSLELTQMLSSDYVCKALEVIYNESEQYPPCLVFERGSQTLEEWMQTPNIDLWEKKSALREILQCLKHIHSHGVVHGDIKPSNIMFFPSTSSWKLLNTDLGAKKGERTAICYTLYTSPEVIQADDTGRKTIRMETSVDMWAFGIIAHEVLAGERFYGLLATEQMVEKSLRRHDYLPGLNSIDEGAIKGLLENLLCMEPKNRWSAERALSHTFFQKVVDTAHCVTASISKKKRVPVGVKSDLFTLNGGILEPKKENLNGLTLQDVLAANLMVTIVMEESILGDGSASWKTRSFREALMMHDDNARTEPVFLLLVGHVVRLRIGLEHRTKAKAPSRKIAGVKVRALDGLSISLKTEEVKSPDKGHEVFAFLNPAELQSKKFRRVSPMDGTAEEKYAMLEVTVDVSTEEGGVTQSVALKTEVVCNMMKYGNRIVFRRFLERSGKLWHTAPKWVKEAAKGAIILATVGAKATKIESLAV